MKAIQITAGLLEVADPPLGLRDHHVAIESATAMRSGRTVDVGADLRDDWGAEGHVRNKMAVHDVYLERISVVLRVQKALKTNMKPIGALIDGIRACFAQLCKVGG